jgi:hypothetical protein
MKQPQKKFTVVLRYPDYYTDAWPDDTYVGVVSAPSHDTAALKLQKRLCRKINRENCGQIEAYEDLAAILVIEGAPAVWTVVSVQHLFSARGRKAAT